MILVDTGPVVALCDPRDRLNRTAVRDLDRLWRQPLILCSPVLTEACFLLRHPAQRARLRRVLTDLSIHAYQADDERRLWNDVLEWMRDYQDHEPDWADTVMEKDADMGRGAVFHDNRVEVERARMTRAEFLHAFTALGRAPA